ncbi:helix-turn-helix domain-containing protein [Streptomyces sp. SID8499]|uniref:helix-turn-helix domain-containing protein n=1 Tax=Streptomyces sp. SID8499 TaxID=2706106 RepID=UPI0013CAAB40|nr:helix-turn-helix domain-containing protein [Streptomyces sp. SID8499]NED31018.1 helix-turn-helix domain-containing protein [Streptomyces sp. SID8499]NED75302.1 helix-turn-helix domain-containing protein [Streptomyces sp. SID9944]
MHNRKGPRPSPPKGCLWIEDAAAHIGLKLTTLRKWRLLGKDTACGMHGFLVGRFVAYKISDLDAYLDRQYQAALAPTAGRVHESRPAEPRRTRRQPARAAA